LRQGEGFAVPERHRYRPRAEYDAVIVGSGFGGTMLAHELVRAGWDVLMVERGDWVRRGPQNWAATGVGFLTPHYSVETPYRVLAGGEKDMMGSFACVGGPSVFYGGVSLRFRVADFEPAPEIAGDSGARWPVGYDELEPHYARAERLIGVAGEEGDDPTEPPRRAPLPHPGGALSPTSRLVWEAARSLGLRPFRLPLAFNHARTSTREPCAACGTCDLFACAVGAKNDLATAVLPGLLARGLELRPRTVAVRLVARSGRVRELECVDRDSGRRFRVAARIFALAAGALASPHLVLASGLDRESPARAAVGRYLMRHWNAVVAGFFPWPPDPEGQFHKQVGLHDFYFGDPDVEEPAGKLGGLQQLSTPPPALLRDHLPRGLGAALEPVVPRITGLLAMAEDQPSLVNGVAIQPSRGDRFGLPQLLVEHRYTPRDRAAGRVLVERARQILRRAGAWAIHVHEIRTFSHAVGTLRMGDDPETSPVDPEGRFRGLENLYVADASVFPTSAAVNPSLTIAASALRIGERLAARAAAEVTLRARRVPLPMACVEARS
jgi:choline dehydrogenase-like flavoprotein